MTTASRPSAEAATATELREAEARITRALIDPATPRPRNGATLPPMPYLRRHLVDHAAAGKALDSRVLTPGFLPYTDHDRLRAAIAAAPPDARATATDPALRHRFTAFRRAAHRWDWNHPDSNAAAFTLWQAALGMPIDTEQNGNWQAIWAHWPVGSSEVLGDPLTGHTGPVLAVATAVLPDGRIVAVTGGPDVMVRIWDLTTSTPIGDPLTGHTHGVRAVATAVLPDGQVVAVTSS
jgi:hypothetical protein